MLRTADQSGPAGVSGVAGVVGVVGVKEFVAFATAVAAADVPDCARAGALNAWDMSLIPPNCVIPLMGLFAFWLNRLLLLFVRL